MLLPHFGFFFSLLPRIADVEGERRRRAQMDEESFGALGDVISRRAGDGRDDGRDDRD